MSKVLETVKVSDFTSTPGGYDEASGPWSGNAFYKKLLRPAFERIKDEDGVLLIDLDGASGYITRFFTGSIGALLLEYGVDFAWNKLQFKSELPSRVKMVEKQLEGARKKEKEAV
jgi:STAS-like domain of unknown function (DUF4325)